MPLSRRSSPTIVRSAAAPAPHRAHASAPQETCRGDPDGGVVDEEAAAEYVSSVGAAAGLPARLHAARAKLGGDPVFFLLTAAAVMTLVFHSMMAFTIPTMLAMWRAANSFTMLADAALEELPSTMAAVRLSGMEISDLTLELSDLRHELR